MWAKVFIQCHDDGPGTTMDWEQPADGKRLTDFKTDPSDTKPEVSSMDRWDPGRGQEVTNCTNNGGGRNKEGSLTFCPIRRHLYSTLGM